MEKKSDESHTKPALHTNTNVHPSPKRRRKASPDDITPSTSRVETLEIISKRLSNTAERNRISRDMYLMEILFSTFESHIITGDDHAFIAATDRFLRLPINQYNSHFVHRLVKTAIRTKNPHIIEYLENEFLPKVDTSHFRPFVPSLDYVEELGFYQDADVIDAIISAYNLIELSDDAMDKLVYGAAQAKNTKVLKFLDDNECITKCTLRANNYAIVHCLSTRQLEHYFERQLPKSVVRAARLSDIADSVLVHVLCFLHWTDAIRMNLNRRFLRLKLQWSETVKELTINEDSLYSLLDYQRSPMYEPIEEPLFKKLRALTVDPRNSYQWGLLIDRCMDLEPCVDMWPDLKVLDFKAGYSSPASYLALPEHIQVLRIRGHAEMYIRHLTALQSLRVLHLSMRGLDIGTNIYHMDLEVLILNWVDNGTYLRFARLKALQIRGLQPMVGDGVRCIVDLFRDVYVLDICDCMHAISDDMLVRLVYSRIKILYLSFYDLPEAKVEIIKSFQRLSVVRFRERIDALHGVRDRILAGKLVEHFEEASVKVEVGVPCTAEYLYSIAGLTPSGDSIEPHDVCCE